jgi:hypothetical protein
MNQMDQSSTPIPVFTDDRGAGGDDPFNLNKLRLSQDFDATWELRRLCSRCRCASQIGRNSFGFIPEKTGALRP